MKWPSSNAPERLKISITSSGSIVSVTVQSSGVRPRVSTASGSDRILQVTFGQRRSGRYRDCVKTLKSRKMVHQKSFDAIEKRFIGQIRAKIFSLNFFT